MTRGRLLVLALGAVAVAGLLVPAPADAGPSVPAGAITPTTIDPAALEGLPSSSTPAAGTGERSPAPTPEGVPDSAPGSPTPEAVIGTDERTRVRPTTSYPARAIVHIVVDSLNSSDFSCTGWMIAKDALATAAHCADYSGPAVYTLIPGRNGGSQPFRSCNPTATGVVVSDSWFASGGNGPSEDDYAAFDLNCKVGKDTGWLGFRQLSDGKLDGLKETIAGYPADKPSGQQWKSKNKISSVNQDQVFYKNDTFGGMSGGPVYRNFGLPCGTCAVAIHTAAIGNPATQNTGTRIRPEVGQFLNEVAGRP
ncbi:MAG: trypsin-like serine protease [Acidimicrobiia bacterium]